jgi:tetratricopeptide (TPR) repeat protein
MDPASIAFAQLAEECRRAGQTNEAVAVCMAGLAYHPGYLSARVTLGRALSELGRLDEARGLLSIVLAAAPDNLAANRALAEVYQRQGQLPDALAFYKKALELAHHDPDLEHAVETIQQAVSPPTPVKTETTPISIEELFDFDTLLEQLGRDAEPKAASPQAIEAASPVQSMLDKVQLPAHDGDPFALLERHLREGEEQRAAEAAAAFAGRQRDEKTVAELEGWLALIVTDRLHQATS